MGHQRVIVSTVTSDEDVNNVLLGILEILYKQETTANKVNKQETKYYVVTVSRKKKTYVYINAHFQAYAMWRVLRHHTQMNVPENVIVR